MRQNSQGPGRAAILGLLATFAAAALLCACSGGAPVVQNIGAAAPLASTNSSSPAAVTAQPATVLSLQGTPPGSVIAGTTYWFEPTVSLSASVVSFTVANLPAWARFDAATGTLSGTPSAQDVGTAAGITVTASDSTGSASIGPFAVVIEAPATTGSATLTWVAPLLNIDGTALTDLAGYHVKYGTSAAVLTQEVTVSDPATTTVTVTALAPGTYYFAVTAVTSAGTESGDSNVASKTI